MWIRRSLLAAAGTAYALLPLTAAAGAPAPVPVVPEPAVPDAVYPLVAYADPKLGGASQTFGAGVFDAGSGGLGAIGDDAVSSLRVGVGFRVLACDRTAAQSADAVDGLGSCRYFDAGWYDRIGGGLDDHISLLTVVAAKETGQGVTVYGEPALSGGKLRLGPGRYEASAGDLDRLDAVRSLAVADGHQAVLCDSDRTTAGTTATAGGNPGLCRVFGPGEHPSVGVGLDGTVSLIAVGGPAVTAADGPALAGAVQSFGPGVHQAAAGHLAPVGNDAISSLHVAAGHRVLACADDQAAPAALGECTLFGSGLHELAGTGLDNGVSLLAVSAGPSTGQVLTAYADGGLTGASGGFGPGMFAAADLGTVGNDAISSLRLAEGGRAVLCEHDETAPGEVGACHLFTAGDHASVGKALNDQTSLIFVAS
ncbi:hypothetical protein [Catellatospora citrea]|uniref:Uncharacterized protein n=1 Tax=Catellatospora citrea TaxID=53366 RepID=A0A8J3KCL8_9ACTN|nr:hypothetical protein [Catellatospora citrea]RKE06149.1 hypothetical protein C8E86_0968 [Catellatospora citrea]GIG00488.1 hypothetical protein Cci01nite_55810 [Catellatospora citrea]